MPILPPERIAELRADCTDPDSSPDIFGDELLALLDVAARARELEEEFTRISRPWIGAELSVEQLHRVINQRNEQIDRGAKMYASVVDRTRNLESRIRELEARIRELEEHHAR